MFSSPVNDKSVRQVKDKFFAVMLKSLLSGLFRTRNVLSFKYNEQGTKEVNFLKG
jgi:hypothetical protein